MLRRFFHRPNTNSCLYLIIGFQLGWISTSFLLSQHQLLAQQQHDPSPFSLSHLRHPHDPPCASPPCHPSVRSLGDWGLAGAAAGGSSSANGAGAGGGGGGAGGASACNLSAEAVERQQEAIVGAMQQQEAEMRRLRRQLVEGGAGGGSAVTATGDGAGEAPCVRDLARKNGTLQWNPKPQRYLIAMCSGGQLSNRLACVRQSMLDAALMNRTLVFPTHGIDYNYDALLDMGAFDECFGPNRVVSFAAYNESVKGRVRVGRFICHVHVYQTEAACDDLMQRYTATLHMQFAKKEIARRRTPGPWFKYPAGDFLRKFNSDHHVIAFGNMFGVGGRELRFQGAAPLVVSPQCRGLLQPSPAIQQAAVGFVNMYLGPSYAAVHLRRGDFFQHCIHGNGRLRPTPCYQPLHQVASCLHRRLQRLPGVSMVFLASNADETERRVLRETLTALGSSHTLISLPHSLQGHAWAEPLERAGVAGSSEVVSFLDKAICALALQFYGTAGSTFSSDIMRLREWWKQGLCETYICPANEPADFLRLPGRSNATASAPSPGAGDSSLPSVVSAGGGAVNVSPRQLQGQKQGKVTGQQDGQIAAGAGAGTGDGAGGSAGGAVSVGGNVGETDEERKGKGKKELQGKVEQGKGGEGKREEGKSEGRKMAAGASGKKERDDDVARRGDGERGKKPERKG